MANEFSAGAGGDEIIDSVVKGVGEGVAKGLNRSPLISPITRMVSSAKQIKTAQKTFDNKQKKALKNKKIIDKVNKKPSMSTKVLNKMGLNKKDVK